MVVAIIEILPARIWSSRRLLRYMPHCTFARVPVPGIKGLPSVPCGFSYNVKDNRFIKIRVNISEWISCKT